MSVDANPPARRKGSLIQGLLSLISPSSAPEKRQWTKSDVTQWLVQRIAEATDTPPSSIDVSTPFADFGLDSRTAVSLAADLEKLLGRELPPTLTWDYPTISHVADFICTEAQREDTNETT